MSETGEGIPLTEEEKKYKADLRKRYAGQIPQGGTDTDVLKRTLAEQRKAEERKKGKK